MIAKVLIVCLVAVGALADVMDDLRTDVAKMCKENNSADKTEDVMKVVTGVADCVNALANKTNVPQEEAEEEGRLKELFKKYCAKTPDFKVCLNGLNDGVKLCTSKDKSDGFAEMLEKLNSVIDFVCDKDGEKITMFYTNGGPQCMDEKEDKIRECGESHIGALKNLMFLEHSKKTIIEEHCPMWDGVTSCIVKTLRECTSPIPANLIDSLFQQIEKNLPCHKRADHFFCIDNKL